MTRNIAATNRNHIGIPYRKSTSLAHATRSRLVGCLCQIVKVLSSILESDHGTNDEYEEGSESQISTQPSSVKKLVMPQPFRDAFACHLYMLFSVMFFVESEAKIGSGLKSGMRRENTPEVEETIAMRALCAQAMLVASQSMSKNRTKMWKRGVPDESVVLLPCRIAYQMLESATGVLARRAASADAALGMIAATVDSGETLLGTIVAALMDLLHSYEHMATLCAELCCMVSEKPTNRLAIEIIREIGRLDVSGQGDSGKASGIKFVSPFVTELAERRPRLVLANISHLLPHLNSEPYCLRSAIVTALGHIIEYIGKSHLVGQIQSQPVNSMEMTIEDGEDASRPNVERQRSSLLDILETRSHDVSSYTRSAVLKAWISLTQAGTLPVERVLPVTALAIDRLNDKTVAVRRQSLQVSVIASRKKLTESCSYAALIPFFSC